MIYTVSDLVKKAQGLADIQNSNFISWRENVDYLNDSFVNIYNQIIQSGDPAFLKQYTLGTDNTLPDDFYQLQSIKQQNGTLIMRQVDSDPLHTFSYRIVNNQIIINGNPTSPVIVRYYPQPPTITLPSISVEYPVNTGYSFACAYKKYICQYKIYSSKLFLLVTDIESSETYEQSITIDTSYTPPQFVMKNGYVYFNILASGNYQLEYFNISDLTIANLGINSTAYNIYNGNDGYIWVNKGGAYNYIKIQAAAISTSTKVASNSSQQLFMMNDDYIIYDYDGSVKTLNYYDSDGNETVNIFNLTTAQLADIQRVWVRGQYIFIQFSGSTTVFTGLSGSYDLDNASGIIRVVDVSDVDESTGYGLSVYNDNSWTNQLVSFFPDTELDFPSQLYFQLLSYQLAIAYKMKQGAETTAIETQLDDAWSTFYDTLRRDANMNVRIKNVN
ncbi:MAG TPA: hypothetical protein DCO75_00095 [Fibrobacteres bacterium]|jgi:hypothetical protein|nr:hypothetical protein [Fibrobacterota bacterium]